MLMTTEVSRYCLLLALVQGIAASSPEPGSPVKVFIQDVPATDDYRLPRNTEPLTYGLRLFPGYDKSSNKYQFRGQVEILIRVNKITPNVTLNAKDIYINSVAVNEFSTQKDLEVDSFNLIPDREQLVITTNKNLLADRQYQIKIIFQGILRTDMTGFYRVTYTEHNATMYGTIILSVPVTKNTMHYYYPIGDLSSYF